MCNVESVQKIAKYLQVSPGKISKNNEQVVTRTNKTSTVSGFTTILTELANESKNDTVKNSKLNPEIEAQVQQWIEYAVLYAAPGSKDKNVIQHLLRETNSHLATKSYFVGHFMTLADLAIFYAIYDLMKTLSPIEKENCLNLSRWFDHLQQQDSIRQGAELLNFTVIHLHGWATGTHL